MSILIKGMDMPKWCDDCEFMQSGYPDWCDLTYRDLDVFISSIRPNWCPLVEVKTPHGKLIDADELLNKLQELFDRREKDARFTGNKGNIVTWNDAIYHIKIAPTIIEAEEEE